MELGKERKLILAAQRGDQQAFAELYDAYVDKIYRYILYKVDSAETADDLTAEVFLRVVEALPQYQDREVPLLVWLYRIAHARVVDHYRRNRRSEPAQDIDSLELSIEFDLDDDLMLSYHQRKIREALRTLTEEQQQVILLRFIESYSLQETADLLGKTTGAIKVMQHRAVHALNRALQQQGLTSVEF